MKTELETWTTEQLKALAYDTILVIEQHQNGLRQINEILGARAKANEPKTPQADTK